MKVFLLVEPSCDNDVLVRGVFATEVEAKKAIKDCDNSWKRAEVEEWHVFDTAKEWRMDE